jgi:hypothetical protein
MVYLIYKVVETKHHLKLKVHDKPENRFERDNMNNLKGLEMNDQVSVLKGIFNSLVGKNLEEGAKFLNDIKGINLDSQCISDDTSNDFDWVYAFEDIQNELKITFNYRVLVVDEDSYNEENSRWSISIDDNGKFTQYFNSMQDVKFDIDNEIIDLLIFNMSFEEGSKFLECCSNYKKVNIEEAENGYIIDSQFYDEYSKYKFYYNQVEETWIMTEKEKIKEDEEIEEEFNQNIWNLSDYDNKTLTDEQLEELREDEDVYKVEWLGTSGKDINLDWYLVTFKDDSEINIYIKNN